MKTPLPIATVQLLILALLSILLLGACQTSQGPTLTAPEALTRTQAGELTLVDIRTPKEWRQTGVAEGALRIDMTSKTFVDDLLGAVDGNKDAPIAIICRTGNRTTYTQRALTERGFSNVYNVKEGMAGSGAGPGWLRRGLPVQRCEAC
jgi:rhodanese-related sulfurtransferase